MEIRNRLTELGVALLILGRETMNRMARGLGRLVPAMHRPALRPETGRSRGDVPGWVLITLMSAILVAGLLALAGPILERMFTDAMDQVKPG